MDIEMAHKKIAVWLCAVRSWASSWCVFWREYLHREADDLGATWPKVLLLSLLSWRGDVDSGLYIIVHNESKFIGEHSAAKYYGKTMVKLWHDEVDFMECLGLLPQNYILNNILTYIDTQRDHSLQQHLRLRLTCRQTLPIHDLLPLVHTIQYLEIPKQLAHSYSNHIPIIFHKHQSIHSQH